MTQGEACESSDRSMMGVKFLGIAHRNNCRDNRSGKTIPS
jgi:hypothetical protein